MKLSRPSLPHFFTDRRVVQFIAILALVNVVAYVMVGKVKAMLTYVAFAVLVRFFSRNLAIVLGVPLILVNLLALQGNMLEGMENNSSESATSPSATSPSATSTNAKDQKLSDDKKKNKPDAKTGQGLSMNPVDSHEDEQQEQQGFEPGRRKNRGYEIDYATTVEDAYDQLNNILGGDGIKQLTADTQGLMKQQMQLAEAMKGMQPLIEKMGPMVENLKGMMGNGKEGLGGILDLAKKMTNK